MLLQGIVNDDPLPCTNRARLRLLQRRPGRRRQRVDPGGGAQAGARPARHAARGQGRAQRPVARDRPVRQVPARPARAAAVRDQGPDGKCRDPDDVLVEGRRTTRLDARNGRRDRSRSHRRRVLRYAVPDDIAHNADPSPDPQTGVSPTPDLDSTTLADFSEQTQGTYDDELLADHFACGDGRCNENIALSPPSTRCSTPSTTGWSATSTTCWNDRHQPGCGQPPRGLEGEGRPGCLTAPAVTPTVSGCSRLPAS